MFKRSKWRENLPHIGRPIIVVKFDSFWVNMPNNFSSVCKPNQTTMLKLFGPNFGLFRSKTGTRDLQTQAQKKSKKQKKKKMKKRQGGGFCMQKKE